MIPCWDNDCGFQQNTVLDYIDCNTDVKFRVQKIKMHAGIGTHIDAPAHCIPGTLTIEDIPLKKLITSCIVIDVSQKANANYSVTCNDIHDFEKKYGEIPKSIFVIIYTGWERFWTQPDKYRNNLIFPSVSKEAAELLLMRDIVGLGIDTLSPDRQEDGFPVHQLLLNAGKYIIENIANCNQLPPIGASIIALPMKIKDGTEAPVRLIGVQNISHTII
jgi:kynurenine formamidase